MIALHGAAKTYRLPGGRPLTALQPTDLSVERGEFVVITGRSGSGKTTLLNIAAGLTRPSSGRVEFGDVDLWSLSDVEQSHLRNRSMGFVFQFPSLLPALDVLRNVTLPLAFAQEDASDGRARAQELLELVGLGDRNGAHPRELSAGQQQRVVIARALIGRPELLLADEPSSDLDEDTENEIMTLFSRIHKETGVTILMVTHARQLVAYGSRHVEMKSGALKEDEGG
jgi:ABC-type lipoprotein export system ATPase subunit